ncbi:unnamed protein product [Brachionus calyciflorus]|uniref:Reverse transcriptase domain-containing protein n=1 Tax=Brachionus calyciflorus TaxID=104777 RepID=A0A813YJJ1_9BILA|nr:unnamed protein product [Brachionus calyciflorus]
MSNLDSKCRDELKDNESKQNEVFMRVEPSPFSVVKNFNQKSSKNCCFGMNKFVDSTGNPEGSTGNQVNTQVQQNTNESNNLPNENQNLRKNKKTHNLNKKSNVQTIINRQGYKPVQNTSFNNYRPSMYKTQNNQIKQFIPQRQQQQQHNDQQQLDFQETKKADNPKLSKFRILPKIHKKNFFVRPIVNCISSPTSKLCLLVYILLQPIVEKCYSYLKDSQHLLHVLDDVDLHQYSNKIKMYSCDVTILYSNIELDLALNILLETVVEEGILDEQNLVILGFEVILKQKKGIAMGAICGPTIANL